MSAYQWGLLVWGGWFFSFVVLELLAVFDKTPWNTLSWTAWQIQAHTPGATVAMAAGLFVLLLHIVLPGHWPSRRPPEGPEGRN